MKNKAVFVCLNQAVKNYDSQEGNTYHIGVLNLLRNLVWDDYKIIILGDFEDQISFNGASPLKVDHCVNLFISDLSYMLNNHEDKSKRKYTNQKFWLNTFISDDPSSFWSLDKDNVFTEAKYNNNVDLSKSLILGTVAAEIAANKFNVQPINDIE